MNFFHFLTFCKKYGIFFSMEKIGKKLKEIIDRNKTTQMQLAKEMGCSVALVNMWISDKRDMSTKDINKFCEICKTTPNYLFGFEDDITEQDRAILRAVKSVSGLQKQTENDSNTSKQVQLSDKERE